MAIKQRGSLRGLRILAATALVVLSGCGGGGGGSSPASPAPVQTIEQEQAPIGSNGGAVSLQQHPVSITIAKGTLATTAPVTLAAQTGEPFVPAAESPALSYVAMVQVPHLNLSTKSVATLTVTLPSQKPGSVGSAWCYYEIGKGDTSLLEATYDPATHMVHVPLPAYAFQATAPGTTVSLGRFSIIIDPLGPSDETPHAQAYLWKSATIDHTMSSGWVQAAPKGKAGQQIAIITHGINNQLVNDLDKPITFHHGDMDDLGAYLKALTKADGTPFYDQVIGIDYNRTAHIEGSAAEFDKIIRSLYVQGINVDLFGHSMGGLVFQAVTDLLMQRPGDFGIRRLFTLGSPHEGIQAKRVIRFLIKYTTPHGLFSNAGVSDLYSDSKAITDLEHAKGDPTMQYIFLAGDQFQNYISLGVTSLGKLIDHVYNPDGSSPRVQHDGIVPVESAWLKTQNHGARHITTIGLFPLNHREMGGVGSWDGLSLDGSPHNAFRNAILGSSNVAPGLVTAEATLYPTNSGFPAIKLTWRFDPPARTAQNVQWQVFRNGSSTPAVVADGQDTSLVDISGSHQFSYIVTSGQQCPSSSTVSASDPGISLGVPYTYNLSLVYRLASANTSPLAPGTTGTTATTGGTGGTTGSTGGGFCYFVKAEQPSSAQATPLPRSTLEAPIPNQSIANNTTFQFSSVLTTPSITAGYVVQLSTSPAFPSPGTVTSAESTSSSTSDQSYTFPARFSGDSFVRFLHDTFGSATTIWWRVGARNPSDYPGPVPDASGKRFIFSSPQPFTIPAG